MILGLFDWLSIGELFRLSPMGLSGCFLNGIAQGAIYVALALYGQAMGFAPGTIGSIISATMLGGMLFQFPIGRVSDRLDRRLVIVATAGLAVPVSLLLAWVSQPLTNLVMLYFGVAILGGLTLPIYSICVAHTNDYLNPGQIVAASGTLVLVSGAGVVFGPTLGSLAVGHFGPPGMFFLLALVQGCTVATALFRI
ncbi:MAG: MFS transporter [Geminicoccaceae bacterium]